MREAGDTEALAWTEVARTAGGNAVGRRPAAEQAESKKKIGDFDSIPVRMLFLLPYFFFSLQISWVSSRVVGAGLRVLLCELSAQLQIHCC
jgi:hypothetical protein